MTKAWGFRAEYAMKNRATIIILIIIILLLGGSIFVLSYLNKRNNELRFQENVINEQHNMENQQENIIQEQNDTTGPQENIISAPDDINYTENSITNQHEHNWVDGFCPECGAKCSHSSHDYNGICELCGKQVWHEYIDGICSCGRELQFVTGLLPEEYYGPCDQQGTTEVYLLNGHLDYATPAEKQIEVYLPYGYNPEKKYDVLFMEGGLGNPFNAFVSKKQMIYYTEDHAISFQMKDIYDHMIKNGDCRPMIIVAIDGYSRTDKDERALDGYEQSANFMKETTIPFIVEHYSTYAESKLPADIQAARNHFGVGGFSNGGYFAFWGGMRTLLDYVANFLPIAGSIRGTETGQYIADHPEFPVNALFCAAGQNDTAAYDQTLWDYQECIGYAGLEEGHNAWFVTQEYAHDWETGVSATYNGMMVLFQNLDSNFVF